MSAHVLLNLLNELRKRDKMRGLSSIYLFFATSCYGRHRRNVKSRGSCKN